MRGIGEEDVLRVEAETDLVALFGSRGVALESEGQGWRGSCPFHSGGEPGSLKVSPADGSWRCGDPGCGKSGGAIEFVREFDGVSLRHAYELLSGGGAAAFRPPEGGTPKLSTVTKLPCPLDASADGGELLGQVVDYYHARLPTSRAASAYLAARGLDDSALLERFRVGFADRTLGLRMPNRQRVAGAELRERLTRLGVYRPSGHEHFVGCVVVPFTDISGGGVAQIYGRRVDRSAPKARRHLYLDRPPAGVFNPAALERSEIVLCESAIDALTFVRHGIAGVTCTFGTDGFTDEIFGAIRTAKVSSVRLAFDADAEGESGAEAAAARLQAIGVECHRVRFPWGQDANSYAVAEGGDALMAALRSAEWLGGGHRTVTRPPEKEESANPADPVEPPEPAEPAEPQTMLAGQAKPAAPEVERRGEYHEMAFGERGGAYRRTYRAGGLDRNNSLEVMKVTLRLTGLGGLMHVDGLDLYRDAERRKFTERASEETGLERELVKRDLGKLLLALEEIQEARLSAASEAPDGAVVLSAADEAAALEFGTAPGLLGRIGDALASSGLVGERANGLAVYLCATSRLLPRPLAAVIQSTSAAGKTALMESVLALFPGEERVKYSAMTGQSLYYMGERSLKNKVLAVVEEEGASKAGYALKLLQSEGELTIASTGKDPHTGRMETQEYHVEGPAAIVLTTTGAEVDEELMNRCLVLSVDESRAQTEAIQQAQREAETPAGIVAAAEREEASGLLQNFQRLLRPVRVANPFAAELTFTAERTRNRRDHTKYLALIKAVALLHQLGRDTIMGTTASGKEIEMLPITIGDIEAANAIAPEVLGRSLDELPPQTRLLLECIKSLVREKMAGVGSDADMALFTRREVRERAGWSEFQTRTHLGKLEAFEYVTRRSGRRGVRYAYELLDGPDEANEAARIGLVDTGALRQKLCLR